MKKTVMPAGPIDIQTLLPHRKPMLLIGQIVAFDDRKAVTRSIAAEKWPMTGQGGTDALVLIELVAQTAGVNNGWALLQREGHGGDQRGWIVGIKKARLFVDAIPAGTEIEVVSENGFEYENFREIQGVARIGGTVAAEVTLQLVQAQTQE